MKIEEFVGRLQGVQQSGAGYVACCPAHDDCNPSMSVTPGKNGGILVHCHAGCTAEQIVKAMGLEMKDLMPDDGEFKGRKGKKRREPAAIDPATLVSPLPSFKAPKKPRDYGELVCNYDYQDETGAVVFRVQRRKLKDGRKTFVQERPDPTSKFGWSYGLTAGNVQRVPFRLPRVIAAGKAGKNVIICEGEKDVLSIEKFVGVVATCNPGGAGKWEKGWGQYFDGVPSVLIIADKDPLEKIDDKTGEKKLFAVGQRHACTVETRLREDGYDGKIVKIVMPDVQGDHVKDFTDWADALIRHGQKVDKSAFQDVVKNSPAWPDAWNFAEADLLDLTRAQKNARNTASPSAQGETEVEDGEPEDGSSGDGGRFGRCLSRSPDRKARSYRVDFRIGGEFTVPLIVNWKEIFYRWQEQDQAGEKHMKQEWRACTLPMMLFWGRKMVEMYMGDKAKMSSRLQSELQSVIALLWLRSRGKFFWDDSSKGYATSLYFDETTGVLMRVRSDEFMSFVATAAEINRESSGFKYLMSLVDDAAMSDKRDGGASEGVVPSNAWDKKDGAVYVSSGDSEMYRIRPNAVDLVQNGTDGVVFMRGKTLSPWKLQPGAGIDPFATASIFNTASWSDPCGCMNMRLWVLNLFYCHDKKPILLVHGPAQSGKTRLASFVKEIIGVRQLGKIDRNVNTVDPGDKGCEAFWVAVNDGKLEIFDNVDDKIPWTSTAFQTASTGGEKKIRKLYSNGEIMVLRSNANMIFTANDPKFITEGKGGMADRTVGIGLEEDRNRKSVDSEFSAEVDRNRDAYLTWIVRTVAKALADDTPVDASINKRHPDYGRFSVRCGRAFGDEPGVIRALSATEINKALLPIRQNAITRAILQLLEDQVPKWKMRFQSKTASEEILDALGDARDEDSEKIYSPRKVGIAFSNNFRQFSQLFKIDGPKKIHGDTVWDIEGLTAGGEAALGEGGKVDLKSGFPKSPIGADCTQTFDGNALKNPPNPPEQGDAFSRAHALSSPFNAVKGNNNKVDDNSEVLDEIEGFEL